MKLKKMSKFSAILLILLIAVSVVYAVVLWSKNVPSTVTITASVSANLYSNLECTTVLTSLDFGNIDKLDLNWHTSAFFYMKYEGSDSPITNDLVVKSVSLPTGFAVKWQDVTDTSGWLADGARLPDHIYHTNDIIKLQVEIQQTTTQPKATYSFSITVQIGM